MWHEKMVVRLCRALGVDRRGCRAGRGASPDWMVMVLLVRVVLSV